MATESKCGTVARALDESLETRSHHSLTVWLCPPEPIRQLLLRMGTLCTHTGSLVLPGPCHQIGQRAALSAAIQVSGAALVGATSPHSASSCGILFIPPVPASSPEPGTQNSSAKTAAILSNEQREVQKKNMLKIPPEIPAESQG